MQDETVVTEQEVPELLNTLTASSLQALQSEHFQDALESLNQAEDLLEAVTNQGGYSDPDLVLVTLHNTAYCHQKQQLNRLNNIEDCCSYLDGCGFNVRTKSVMEGAEKKGGEGFRKLRYQGRNLLQQCAMLSQSQRHSKALVQAKNALKVARQIFKESLRKCQEVILFNTRLSRVAPKNTLKFKVQEQLAQIAQKALPILEAVQSKIHNKKIVRGPRIDIRSVLGVQHHNDWIFDYNIGDLMTIEPMSLVEIKSGAGLIAEFAKDLLFEKIVLLITSYFCISTEIRFLNGQKSGNLAYQDAKLWHARALDIAQTFLPKSSPLEEHVLDSYKRNYGDAILENSFNKPKFLKKNALLPLSNIKPRSSSNKGQKRPVFRLENIYKRPKSSTRKLRLRTPERNKVLNTDRTQLIQVQMQREYKSDKSLTQKPSVKNLNKTQQLLTLASKDLYGDSSDIEDSPPPKTRFSRISYKR